MQNEKRVLVWKLADESIHYLFAPANESTENDIINEITSYDSRYKNAIRLPDMKYGDLPTSISKRYWRWDSKQQKIITTVNDERWRRIRSYRDYLLKHSDGLASALVLKKLAGDESNQLNKEINQLNKYKQKLRDIPQTYNDPIKATFPNPVLGLKPMSAQEFLQKGG